MVRSRRHDYMRRQYGVQSVTSLVGMKPATQKPSDYKCVVTPLVLGPKAYLTCDKTTYQSVSDVVDKNRATARNRRQARQH